MLILESTTDTPTPTGPMRLHIFRPALPGGVPAPGAFPGLIFFSEIFQVTAPIRREAAWFAGHGYLVAVPEIYHEYLPAGTVLGYDKAGTDTGNELKVTKPVGAYASDAAAAVAWLQSEPGCNGRIGAIGNCIGGHLAFRAAMHTDVRAAACFYATDIHKGSLGAPPGDDSLARVAKGDLAHSELLMIWGRQDPHVDRAGRRRIYEALADAEAHFQWCEFNGQHAFMRDEGHRYDPALARTCLGMCFELFARRLGGLDTAAAAPRDTGPQAC